jgi:hypothetical protein
MDSCLEGEGSSPGLSHTFLICFVVFYPFWMSYAINLKIISKNVNIFAKNVKNCHSNIKNTSHNLKNSNETSQNKSHNSQFYHSKPVNQMRTRKKFILAQILIANPSSERNPPSNPAS